MWEVLSPGTQGRFTFARFDERDLYAVFTVPFRDAVYDMTILALSPHHSKRVFCKLRFCGRLHFAPGAFACTHDLQLRLAHDTVTPPTERLGVAGRLTDSVRGHPLRP